jgi:hypothetical protein
MKHSTSSRMPEIKVQICESALSWRRRDRRRLVRSGGGRDSVWIHKAILHRLNGFGRDHVKHGASRRLNACSLQRQKEEFRMDLISFWFGGEALCYKSGNHHGNTLGISPPLPCMYLASLSISAACFLRRLSPATSGFTDQVDAIESVTGIPS